MPALRSVRRGLLPSAARTASTASVQFEEYSMNSGRLFLNITVASGTGGLKVQFRAYDKYGNGPVAFGTGGTAVTATGLYIYEMCPSTAAATGAIQEAISRELPQKWDAFVTAGDSSSYTYSLSFEGMGT